MPQEKIKIGNIISRAAIDSSSYDEANNTVRVVFATEEPVFVRHWDGDYFQVLSCTEDAVRAERLNNGSVHLLDTHDDSTVKNVYGRVIKWGITDKQCWADVKLTSRPDASGVITDIKTGILRSVSVKARPWGAIAMPEVAGQALPTIKVTAWEPMEISLAAVPADYAAIVRNNQEETSLEITLNHNINRTAMENNGAQGAQQTENAAAPAAAAATEPTTAAPAAPAASAQEDIQRTAGAQNNPPVQVAAPTAPAAQQAAAPVNAQAEIIRSASAAGLDMAFAATLIERNLSLDASKAAILDEIARRDSGNTVRQPGAQARVNGNDEGDIERSAIITGLMHRAEPGSVDMQAAENARAHNYKYATMVDIARSCLTKAGHNTAIMSPSEIISRAMATTDYPDLLTSTTQRFLRKYYNAVVPDWKPFGTQVNAPDFRAKTGIKVDANVTFEELAEGASYQEAKIISNEKAIVQLKTYARKFSITRIAMINDDLSVFTKLPKWIALGAQQFQSQKFWALISGNATSSDNVALFHTATHKNLASSGGAISETTLATARTAMRRQKSPEGNLLMITPTFLIVPPELETIATKTIGSIMASASNDINTFYGKLKVHVADYLSNTQEWYLAADPNNIMADGLVYSYLEGQEGMFTESYIDKDNDNLVQKARLDFDARVWGHQGWYKNPGA